MNERISIEVLSERIALRVNIETEKIKRFIHCLFNLIKNEVNEDEKITIHNFGTFRKKWIEQTERLNPKTREKIMVPAHYKFYFSPASSAALKVNKEFSSLKPVIIGEDPVHVKYSEAVKPSLLRKAEQYRARIMYENELKNISLQPSEERTTENTSSKKTEKKKNNLLWLWLLLLLLLIGLSIGVYYFFSIRNAQGKETAVLEQHVPKVDKKAAAPYAAHIARPGDSFSLLAELYWDDIFLWPHLYMLNSSLYPDPDKLYPGNPVNIPPAPGAEDRKTMEQDILSVYQIYKNFISLDSNPERVSFRKRNLYKSLAGAEILYPGFLDRHNTVIDSIDRAKAKELASGGREACEAAYQIPLQ